MQPTPDQPGEGHGGGGVEMQQRRYWFDPIDVDLTTAELLADLDPGLLDWAPELEEISR